MEQLEEVKSDGGWGGRWSEDLVELVGQGLAGGASLRAWLLMSSLCSLGCWDLPGQNEFQAQVNGPASQDQVWPGLQGSLISGAYASEGRHQL